MRFIFILLTLLLVSCGKPEKPNYIPDLGGREITVACWIDGPILCREEGGQLKGIFFDYYTEACKIINCVPKFFKTDSTNLRTMMIESQVTTAFIGQITLGRLGLTGGELSPVTSHYGIFVRKDAPWQTIEELVADTSAVIPIRSDWPLPDIHFLFKDHEQLADWPLTTNVELIQRGAADAFMDAGVVRDGKITFFALADSQRYLDGNTTDYLRYVPTFSPGNEELAPAFDVATAIMFNEGTMAEIVDRHLTGTTMTFRERVIE